MCKFNCIVAIIYVIVLSAHHNGVSGERVKRTVAANGLGADIRGCGVEGNIYCNTTQFAIFESNSGDEIILLKGIHVCDTNITTGGGGIRFVQRDGTTAINGIFIHGANGTRNDNVIYDCKHTKRAFAFMSGSEGMNTVLSNFSISNGNVFLQSGGGVLIHHASPTLNHIIWTQNVAQSGGGVLITGSGTKPTFNNCTFRENKVLRSSGGDGGGVFIQSQAQPVFNHVIWIRNEAPGGGGVYIQEFNTISTFNNCKFQENKATGLSYFGIGGGGVYIRHQGEAIFNQVIWIHNEASNGGGVYIRDSNTNATFNNCKFQENKATNGMFGAFGGGVYIQSEAKATFYHVIWIRNEAQNGGGVSIKGSNTNPLFHNCTFQENNVTNGNSAGGGVYIQTGAQPIFNRVILIRNVAQAAGGGVFIRDSNTNPTFNKCTFQENKATSSNYGGGGVYVQEGAQPIFNHVILVRNVAQGDGGAVLISSSAKPIFNHAICICNVAQGYGGCVYIADHDTNPRFDNCTFQNNTSAKSGGAVLISLYTDKQSYGTCATAMTFINKNIFQHNKAVETGGAIYINIIQPKLTASNYKIYKVPFTPACFQNNNAVTYINNHATLYGGNNLATPPYKLNIEQAITPATIAPGIGIIGILQVVDVFGRKCTEITHKTYTTSYVEIRTSENINFQGFPYFIIYEKGIIEIGYTSNILEIENAALNLVDKTITFEFFHKTLFPINSTMQLVKCLKGYKASLTKNHRFGCEVCPGQQYSVISGGICHDCPTIGAVCMGRDNVYVIPGYYGHIDDSDGKISIFECNGGQCCPHLNDTSLETYDVNGIGCRIGSGKDCATNRDPSTPFCGSCISGYSEVLGSSICRKCTSINWFWFILPFPVGMLSIIYLLRKTYMAATKNILFTLIFKNLMFFYQVVGLVLSPSQLVKRVSGPLLMLFSFNVATNEADHSDSNDNDNSNPFNCLVPNLTPIGKLAFNIYPMGILLFVCFPICIYIFRKNEKKNANVGPALMTCLLSLYASMTKFLIQLVNCRMVGNELILFSAPNIICFKDTSWVWQLSVIIGIISIALVPYLLYRYAKLKRGKEEVKNNRWMLVVTKSYREDCWWYTSVDMGRRLFLIIIATLPIDHENKLVMLTIGFLLVRTVHSHLKPFPHMYLNHAEDICLGLLVIISAIASSRAARLQKNTDGTYDHPMDPFLLILVMCPFVGSIFFSGWYTYMERKKSKSEENTAGDVVNRTWAPNPLNGIEIG
eukprot:g8297.t1